MLGRATRGGDIHLTRIGGGGAGAPVTAAQQAPSHMFPRRRNGWCTRYRVVSCSRVSTTDRVHGVSALQSSYEGQA